MALLLGVARVSIIVVCLIRWQACWQLECLLQLRQHDHRRPLLHLYRLLHPGDLADLHRVAQGGFPRHHPKCSSHRRQTQSLRVGSVRCDGRIQPHSVTSSNSCLYHHPIFSTPSIHNQRQPPLSVLNTEWRQAGQTIIFMQDANSKAMMLAIHFDEEDSDDSEPTPKPIKPTLQPSHTQTRYQSSALTRGFFQPNTDDDYDFELPPPPPQPKVETSPRKVKVEPTPLRPLAVPQPVISLLREIEYDSSDEEERQEKPEIRQEVEDIEQEEQMIHDERLVVRKLGSRKLLEMKFEQSDDEEEGEHQAQEEEGEADEVRTESREEDEEAGEEGERDPLSLKQHELMVIPFSQIASSPDQRRNRMSFCLSGVPKGQKAVLSLYRDQSGFNILWPQFLLQLQENGATMGYAKKMMANTTSNYYLSVEPGIQNAEHAAFLGKVRSNFSGSEFNIYSAGVSIKKISPNHRWRHVMATIKFLSQVVPMQPREFEVYLLKEGCEYRELEGFFEKGEVSLDVLYKRGTNNTKIDLFRNRRPTYSEAVKGYILNFGGRVQKASIKNFILEDPVTQREVMMLGKSTDDIFRIDVSWPMPPAIAMAICLANFDSKFITA